MNKITFSKEQLVFICLFFILLIICFTFIFVYPYNSTVENILNKIKKDKIFSGSS